MSLHCCIIPALLLSSCLCPCVCSLPLPRNILIWFFKSVTMKDSKSQWEALSHLMGLRFIMAIKPKSHLSSKFTDRQDAGFLHEEENKAIEGKEERKQKQSREREKRLWSWRRAQHSSSVLTCHIPLCIPTHLFSPHPVSPLPVQQQTVMSALTLIYFSGYYPNGLNLEWNVHRGMHMLEYIQLKEAHRGLKPGDSGMWKWYCWKQYIQQVTFITHKRRKPQIVASGCSSRK